MARRLLSAPLRITARQSTHVFMGRKCLRQTPFLFAEYSRRQTVRLPPLNKLALYVFLHALTLNADSQA